MTVVLASRNSAKVAEIRKLFAEFNADINVLSLSDIGFEGEIVEDGESFEENAVIKTCAPVSLGYIGIADDSGLCVDALGGAPGIYSARFSGEDHTDAKNRELLKKRLENVPDDERGAHFVCVTAAVFPHKYNLEPIVCRGECRGKIIREERGEGGFGYDSLFLYEEANKTFAEMTAEEKGTVSHRGRAMKKFAEMLSMAAEKVDGYNT
ncbi:MAG: RdgB/HAM1 family non-canonical purine NTP pyrophosphatase [Firmicutes bacterium]|nr:RdgB/HAM1 family non-canonical purine NTP pyrophosphatase [Bacillota bacterium]